VADIAYALRDLFEEGIDLEDPSFQAFIKGYRSETELDMALLKEIPMFMKLHDIVSFAKLLRSVDIPESDEYPEWLVNLKSKFVRKLEDYRQSFKK
jgi:Ser/Thr protein kinase RdoA (MazF antagonist)